MFCIAPQSPQSSSVPPWGRGRSRRQSPILPEPFALTRARLVPYPRLASPRATPTQRSQPGNGAESTFSPPSFPLDCFTVGHHSLPSSTNPEGETRLTNTPRRPRQVGIRRASATTLPTANGRREGGGDRELREDPTRGPPRRTTSIRPLVTAAAAGSSPPSVGHAAAISSPPPLGWPRPGSCRPWPRPAVRACTCPWYRSWSARPAG